MKSLATLILTCLFILTGCQSFTDTRTASSTDSQSLPASTEVPDRDSVLLSARHCLSEYLSDQGKTHYGPCLKIISIDGNAPRVRDDGFIEIPAATSTTLKTSCVYRHADGSPIPATMETTDFQIAPGTFTSPGQRWYLHAHKQARQVVGCEPTLSRSKSPTRATD